MNFSPEELEICLNVLQQVSDNPSAIDNVRFNTLVAKIHKQGRKKARRTIREIQQAEDNSLRASALIVKNQYQEVSEKLLPSCSKVVSETPNKQELNKPINCYICKREYTQVHFFYHSLCPQCAEFNYQKRHQSADLSGRVALVTGGRIKIGYQTALRMLRDGAKVIVTTRFPRDCAKRFSAEADFSQWCDKLQIHGLDLRNLPALEAFINYLTNAEISLDIMIHNAAQTVKRPLEFYQHLLADDGKQIESLSSGIIKFNNTDKLSDFVLESQDKYEDTLPANSHIYFPKDTFDIEGQQLDMRPINSWMLKLDEVSTVEMLEVQLVNNIAPFILNSKLKKLMLKSRFERRFIINVSAMEGQFNRRSKTVYHPHTNMAKAALNMMTRTSAADYVKDGIYMNSVDTGWITDENPYSKKIFLQEERSFFTPLDIIDGMARIYDPIVMGLQNDETPVYGLFLKDYMPYAW
jgi:NAD(P)-dependent dehydrogenase (short-subunit alcohol dehydrogenase family)